MSHQHASDEMARQLRTAWFTYLDTIEPVRPALYRYCRRLARDVWDAEDLLQETLLRGFGAIGRGDLHGDGSGVRDTRAYLFRVATNLWIDQLRHNEARFGRPDFPKPLTHARAGGRDARSGCEAAYSGLAAAACGHRAERRF